MDTPHPKKQKLDEIQNSNSQQVPSCFPKYYIISGTDEQNPMKKVSPMKGNLIVKAQIGTVEKIMRMPNGDLIVGLLNQAQITNAKKITMFDTAPVRVTPHSSMNKRKGVIRCPALIEIPEEEIVEGLADQGVCDARKIYFNREGKKIPSSTVILTFERSILPKNIMAGYLNLKVDVFIPNPLRCFKCFRYGHPVDKCKRQAICAKCSKEDHTNDRECQNEAHCINCSGNHSAFSKDCPKWLEEKEIQRVRVTENLSFPEARQRVRPAPAPGTSYSSVVKKMVPTGTQTMEQGCQTDLQLIQSNKGNQAKQPLKLSQLQKTKPPKEQKNTNRKVVNTKRFSGRLSKAEKDQNQFTMNKFNYLRDELLEVSMDDDDNDDNDSTICDSAAQSPCNSPSRGCSGGRSPIKAPK